MMEQIGSAEVLTPGFEEAGGIRLQIEEGKKAIELSRQQLRRLNRSLKDMSTLIEGSLRIVHTLPDLGPGPDAPLID
jgi:hypothetical protein